VSFFVLKGDVFLKAHFDIAREHSKEIFKEVTNDNIDGLCHFNFHSQIELYFIDDGKINAFVNSHAMLLEKDQMAIALSYDSHLFRSVGASKSSIFVIPPDTCKDFMAAVQNKKVKNPFICDRDTVKEIKSYVNLIKAKNCNEVKLRGYLYIILGIILENIFLENDEAAVNTDISAKILLYLNRNFKNEISLDSMSAELGYTQSYISRCFKNSVGIGLTRYINILRLRNFLFLANDKKHSHTYCALESGFPSMRTFYRVFKQEFKCTPKEYLSK